MCVCSVAEVTCLLKRRRRLLERVNEGDGGGCGTCGVGKGASATEGKNRLECRRKLQIKA